MRTSQLKVGLYKNALASSVVGLFAIGGLRKYRLPRSLQDRSAAGSKSFLTVHIQVVNDTQPTR